MIHFLEALGFFGQILFPSLVTVTVGAIIVGVVGLAKSDGETVSPAAAFIATAVVAVALIVVTVSTNSECHDWRAKGSPRGATTSDHTCTSWPWVVFNPPAPGFHLGT